MTMRRLLPIVLVLFGCNSSKPEHTTYLDHNITIDIKKEAHINPAAAPYREFEENYPFGKE